MEAIDLAYSVVGFFVGFIIGMTGVGGGSLMTPLLVIVFGIKPLIAVGTDLLYAAITKSGGVLTHHRKATIQWPIVGLLSLGSVPATLCMLYVIKNSDVLEIDHENFIMTVLGLALIFTSLFLFGKDKLQAISKDRRFSLVVVLQQKYSPHITIFAGAIVGILVTLSSVGAGVIGAAFLFFLYPNLRTISVVGTDLAHAVPITAIAGLGHVTLGTVDFRLLGLLLVGSLPGIFLGSHTGVRLPEKIIRAVLAWILLIVGIRLAI